MRVYAVQNRQIQAVDLLRLMDLTEPMMQMVHMQREQIDREVVYYILWLGNLLNIMFCFKRRCNFIKFFIKRLLLKHITMLI